MRRQPRSISISRFTYKISIPFMKLGMAVGKSQRAGIAVIDGRTISGTSRLGNKQKTIINRGRVFIRKHHAFS